MDASVSGFFATGIQIQELPMICHKHVYQRRLFHMQKDFAFYQLVIKMEICKQRLDANNSVICELVSICCESNNINKAYDLH